MRNIPIPVGVARLTFVCIADPRPDAEDSFLAPVQRRSVTICLYRPDGYSGASNGGGTS